MLPTFRLTSYTFSCSATRFSSVTLPLLNLDQRFHPLNSVFYLFILVFLHFIHLPPSYVLFHTSSLASYILLSSPPSLHSPTLTYSSSSHASHFLRPSLPFIPYWSRALHYLPHPFFILVPPTVHASYISLSLASTHTFYHCALFINLLIRSTTGKVNNAC